jgi:hypothetical protein
MLRVSKICPGNDGGVVFPPPTFTVTTVNEPHEDLSLDTSRPSIKKVHHNKTNKRSFRKMIRHVNNRHSMMAMRTRRRMKT